MAEEVEESEAEKRPYNVTRVPLVCPFHTGEIIYMELGFVNHDFPMFHLQMDDELRNHFNDAMEERRKKEETDDVQSTRAPHHGDTDGGRGSETAPAG